jgi:hypothetical protein
MLASASSDGEVRTWIISNDGSVKESGSYDSGNRLLCLAMYDAAIEKLDSFPPIPNDSDSMPSSEDESDESEEWNGISDS